MVKTPLLHLFGHAPSKIFEDKEPRKKKEGQQRKGRRGRKSTWDAACTYYLVRHYYTKTLREIAEDLGYSLSTIRWRVQLLKEEGRLVSKQQHKDWTTKELSFLKENYLSMNYDDIAKALGRTAGAVKRRIADLRADGKIGYKNTWGVDYESVEPVQRNRDRGDRS